ncbi:MAG TPA: hypothetical protein VEZ55_11220 [Chitinophagaceae bacterium]|nr:hypothetical protein [Chitinophagaceae bacterium]
MRLTLLLTLMIFTTTLQAQIFRAGEFLPNHYRTAFSYNRHPADSFSQKKWFITRYSALSTSYGVYNGGQAIIVAAPVGLQINRQLNNNLYAFANATIAPAHITFNRSFIANASNKAIPGTGFSRSSRLDIYSSAALGLQYVNDEKTFSISGSIGVERSSYPLLPYYRAIEQRPTSTSGANR